MRILLDKQICFRCPQRMRHITRSKSSNSNITFKKDWNDGYVCCFAFMEYFQKELEELRKKHDYHYGNRLSIHGTPPPSCPYLFEQMLSAEKRGIKDVNDWEPHILANNEETNRI